MELEFVLDAIQANQTQLRQYGVRSLAVFGLEIIGEAAKHIPDTVRMQYPEIEWHS